EGPAQRGDLLGLAPAHERRRVRSVAALHHPPDHVGAGAVDQLGQLVEVLVDHLVRPAREDHADQDDALPDGALDERPGQQVAQESIPGWMSTSATLRTGPARCALACSSSPRVTSSVPPGLRTRRGPSAWTAPQLRAAAAAATLPVPQAS